MSLMTLIAQHTKMVAGITLATSFFRLSSLLFLAALSASCMQNSSSELRDVEAEIERSSLSAFDLHSFVTDNGAFKYEFQTPELHQYDNVEEPYTDFPQGLDFKGYTQDGQLVKSSISCRRARFYKDKNLWELNNDVVAVTERGDVVNTEQLFWNTQTHKVYSDKFVKITTSGQYLTGHGFESDDQLSKYEILHPGGVIEVDD